MTTEALVPAAGKPVVATGGGGEDRPAAGDRRRGAVGGGAVPGVLRRKDREREDAGGVRESGGAIPGVVRGARPRAARRLPAPRGRLHPDTPRVGPHGEAAPGRDPHARRLARRQPSPPREPRGRGAGAEARRHEGRDAGPLAGGGEEAPWVRSTRAPWPGSGTGRCSR